MRGTFGFLIAAILFLLLTASSALAAGLIPCGGQGESACTICHLGILVINVTNFLIEKIAFPAAALLTLIGGLALITAGPSEQRLKFGKQVLTSTIIGLIIVLVSWLAVDTIIKILVGGFQNLSIDRFIGTVGPWNDVPVQCNL